MHEDLIETLMEKTVPSEDGCLLWLGKLTSDCLAPVFTLPRKKGEKEKQVRVSRLMWEIQNDEQLGSRRLKRTCSNANSQYCVDPSHYELA